MLNRRLASLLAAVTVAGVAVTGCAGQAAAVRVGDSTMSRPDFEDHLDLVYENDGLRDWLFTGVTSDMLRPEDAPPGAFTQEYVGAMATLHVQFMLFDEALDREGLEIDEDQRDQVSNGLQEAVGDLDDLPEEKRDVYLDGFAAFETLQAELGAEDFNALVGEIVDSVDISVASTFGTWDGDSLRVTPPPGATPAAAAGGESSTG